MVSTIGIRQSPDLDMIPQHQLLGVRMQIHLLVHPRCARYKHPLGHRIAVQVVLQQRQGHDQGQQALPVILDETQELQPTEGRPCPSWRRDSSGTPSGAGALSAWVRSLISLDTNGKKPSC